MKQVVDKLAEAGLRGVSPTTIHRYEKGRPPDAGVLLALAKLYRADFGELIAELASELSGATIPLTGAGTPVTVHTPSGVPQVEFRAVPVMSGRIAAGEPLLIEDADFSDALAFSEKSMKKWRRPRCVRVGNREESMIAASPPILPNDIVVLETDPDRLLPLQHDKVYAVRVDGGSTLKKVEHVITGDQSWLLLISENPDKKKYKTRPIAIPEGASLLDFIIGRVEWHGQYL